MAQRLPNLRLELEDGTAHEIQPDNRDMIAYDLERGRRQWPAAADGPILWMTFCAWHALKRTGQPVPARFDQAVELVVALTPLGADGEPADLEELEDVDPTTASSSSL